MKALKQHRRELGAAYKEVVRAMPKCEQEFCRMETCDEKNLFAQLMFTEPPKRRLGVFSGDKPQPHPYRGRQVLVDNWTLVGDESAPTLESKEEQLASLSTHR